MNCEQATEFLPEYWDSVLDDIPRRELEAHLATCHSCRGEAKVEGFLDAAGRHPG